MEQFKEVNKFRTSVSGSKIEGSKNEISMEDLKTPKNNSGVFLPEKKKSMVSQFARIQKLILYRKMDILKEDKINEKNIEKESESLSLNQKNV